MHFLLFSLIAVATAQSPSQSAPDTTQITWGSVSFITHGEKTPILANPAGRHTLTPLGAQQALLAGRGLRQRYISKPQNGSAVTDFYPIRGMDEFEVLGSDLDILVTSDEYQFGSALAFMQGLYPPRGGSGQPPDLSEPYQYAPGAGGLGTLLDYPLDGYQYPNIRTVSSLDINSIWVAGHLNCDNYALSEIRYKSTSSYRNRVESTSDFYKSHRYDVFGSFGSPSLLDFRYASQLYEYAQYEWNHNQSLYGSAQFGVEDLTTMFNLASEQEMAINGLEDVGTIGGRTLAGRVLQSFERLLQSDGYSNKMSLLFTTYEPLLSFFILSGLSTGPSSPRFESLPLPGSHLTFELFSYQSGSSTPSEPQPFPALTDLQVRFLFRNGSAPGEAIRAYPLFGRPLSETDMSWSDFVEGMESFALNDVDEWCAECEASNLFCSALEYEELRQNNSNLGSGSSPFVSSSGNALSPAVYGVIGAVVTLAFAILGLIILAFFGFRIRRNERGEASKKRESDLGILKYAGNAGGGGFKGAEKLASDTDLRLKGGAGATVVRHERVGSWELSDSPTLGGSARGSSASGGMGSLDKDIEAGLGDGRRISRRSEDIRRSEDGIGHVNPFGDPVKPLEGV